MADEDRSLHERLVRATDRDALAVLADELEQTGNLLGRAISLSLADPPVPEALGAFVAAHRAELLGARLAAWAERGATTSEWRDGLVDTLGLFPWPHVDQPELAHLAELFTAPSLARLRVLQASALTTNGTMEPLWDALPVFPRLETLEVGWTHLPHADEHQLSWLWLGAIGEAAARQPSLRTLACRGSAPSLDGLDHSLLESLRVESSTFSPEAMAALMNAKLPALARLELAIGDGEYGPCADLSACGELIAAATARFPRLRHLGLCNTPYTNELVPVLAASTLLGQLVSLDLSLGVLDGAGARELQKRRAAFAHLETLELGDNVLDATERAALVKALPSVRFARDGWWRTAPKTRRYVSLSE